jgi:organic radical activating enzyme
MEYNGHEIIAGGEDIYSSVVFDWRLIDVCNYKCSYCGAGFGSDLHRPVSNFFKSEHQQNVYIDVLKRLNMRYLKDYEVTLLGGEPTLHPHLFEILRTLETYTECKKIRLVTNLTKPISYFDQIDQLNCNKLLVTPSIHFEYYREITLTKCLQMKQEHDYDIMPIIMLHDKEKYWDDMLHFMDICIENNLEYEAVFIEDMCGYTANYTDTFYGTFADYLNNNFTETYKFTTTRGTLQLTREQINRNDLKRFKGWNCTPQMWCIESDGSIVNDCTGEYMHITGKNVNKKVKCPLDCCNCDIKWVYSKYKE